jgi:hypothetical protein
MLVKRIGVAVALVAVAVTIGLVVQAMAAPAAAVALKLPDLVVKEVKVERIGGGEFPAHDFTVTIKNRGAGNAGATTLGVLGINDVTAGATGAGVAATAPTPAVPAGGQVTVRYQQQMPIDKAYWVFVADAPVAGRQLGRLVEAGGATRGKCNNSFVVAFNSSLGNPQVFTNPAAL